MSQLIFLRGQIMKYLYNGPKKAKSVLLLAHGAGAPMDSDWMNELANGLERSDLLIVRFEFPYMQEFRSSGKKRPPDTQKKLIECWSSVIKDHIQFGKIYISGKSMGGRVASLVADENKVNGLICFGFPFHAPGKEAGDRIKHLKSLKTKTLIIQGDRDPFGTKEEVPQYELSNKIRVHWLPDGDHSFKPRKKSGHTMDENLQKCIDQVHKFIK